MSVPIQNGIVQELKIIDGASLASDITSIAQDIRFFQLGSMQITWSGASNKSGMFLPQVSLDLQNWCNIIDTADAATTDTVETCSFYAFDIAPFPYMRLVYTHGTNTAGTFTVRTFFKKMNTGG